MFFRGSLDKLGIYPDIFQIGKYKTAGDMFTRKEMSDAHREYHQLAARRSLQSLRRDHRQVAWQVGR